LKNDDLFLQYEKEVAEFKLSLIRRLTKDSAPVDIARRKRTSNLDMVEDVLAKAGKPLHVSAIITAVLEEYEVSLDRDSISSAIAKQIRKGKRFVRSAPNTFGLRQQ